MPSQSHKTGRLVALSVSGAGAAPALAAAVQAWLLTVLAPARYLVVASTREGVASCSATAVVATPKRADNLRASLRSALAGVTVDSVCVSDGSDDVRRAAQLLQGAPPDAAVRLEGWHEAELRSPAAVAAVVPSKPPRLRWLPRSRAMSVLAQFVTPRDVLRHAPCTAPPHPDWALCPPDAACAACQAFSAAVTADICIDVPALLRAALAAGWDTSALHSAAVKEQLAGALADWFRHTFLCAPMAEAPACKRKCTRSDGM